MNELFEIIIDFAAQGYQITFNKGKMNRCLKVELQMPELPNHLKLTVTQEVSFQAVELVNLDVLKEVLHGMKGKINQYKKDHE